MRLVETSSATMEIPLEFFPSASDSEMKKKKPPTKLHGVLTVPTNVSVGESDLLVLLLHGAGGDLHSGHLAGVFALRPHVRRVFNHCRILGITSGIHQFTLMIRARRSTVPKMSAAMRRYNVPTTSVSTEAFTR